MSKWWYAINNTKNGPITLADLVQLFRAGQVELETLVWEKGMKDWQPIGSLPHLMSVFGVLPKASRVTDDTTKTDTGKPRIDISRVDTPGVGVPKVEKKSRSFIVSAFVWLGVFGFVGLAAYFYVFKISIPTVASPPVQAQPKDPSSGLLWTNPLTQVQLQIDDGWRSSSKVIAKGLLQHTFTEKNERAYVALAAKAGVQSSLATYVAAFQKDNVDRIEFKGEATESEKNGVRVWRREGAIKKMTNYRVRVDIVQIGNTFWDIEVIQVAPFSDTDGKVYMLVSSLLTTLK